MLVKQSREIKTSWHIALIGHGKSLHKSFIYNNDPLCHLMSVIDIVILLETRELLDLSLFLAEYWQSYMYI